MEIGNKNKIGKNRFGMCSKKGFGNSFPKPFLYRKVHVIVLAGNSVFYTNGKSVGHSFMQIPVKFIESLKVDLGKEEDVREVINKYIFEMSSSVKMSIKLVYAEDYITNYIKVPKETPIIFIEEIFYNKEKEAISRGKFYFLPEEYDIVFQNRDL